MSEEMIVWQQPDGSIGRIAGDDLRALAGYTAQTPDEDDGWTVTYTDENTNSWVLNAQNAGHARSLASRMSALHKAATVRNVKTEPVFTESWINGSPWRPAA